jgi:probable FeS assembly SUF system protein SufT
MQTPPPLPIIRLSSAARRELLAARGETGGESIRLLIGPGFGYDLHFDKPTDTDVAVEADGITFVLDAASARRADGVLIDFVTGPLGSGFKIDNPNKPGASKQVEVRRDCEATLIPSGEKRALSRGESVLVTQAPGSSITIRTSAGALARIAACDADAVGVASKPPGQEGTGQGAFNLDAVFDRLKQVFDPEIPVNVVDLGLIYACEAYPLEDGGHRVEIKMAMTAPGCGMGDILKEDARARVQEAPGVDEVDVEIVWEPPWDPSRMSEAAWLQLGVL